MISGHRGARALAPENTLAGMNLAADCGVEWIEIDTQLSKDGIPVIIHDKTVNRCTNGRGKVASLTLEQLQSLDAGSWFDPHFATETIPTLSQTLELCTNRGLSLNLEIKIYHPREAEPLIDAIADVIKQHNYPAEKLLLSSFDIATLQLCQTHLPEVRRGYICDTWNNKRLAKLANLDLFSIHIDHRILTPEIAETIKQQGLILKVWTLNDPSQAERMYGMGVDNIITDNPPLFMAKQ
ncbi:glycerophosphodiester phosphodiesterase [Photobacterium aquae]|uniref:Glycerophosphodiester phosphodiesterase n=1 Tax=Photobacterium aquae TaxID=1195763 RepID=A0A0J1GUP0_9GAMM|nr:glycerophosphoryl diester phosphodiesterase [Photobacterium aquae]KLV03381.1 glycerophosphodiester phosphodiesterase [Photobacterium aquae]